MQFIFADVAVELDDHGYVIGTIDREGEFFPANGKLEIDSWRDLVGLAAEILLETDLQDVTLERFGDQIGDTKSWLVRPGARRPKSKLLKFDELFGKVESGHGITFALRFAELAPGVSVTLRRNNRVEISGASSFSSGDLCDFAAAVLGDIRTLLAAPDQYAPFLGELVAETLNHQRYSTGTLEPLPTGPSKEELRDEILQAFAADVRRQAATTLSAFGL